MEAKRCRYCATGNGHVWECPAAEVLRLRRLLQEIHDTVGTCYPAVIRVLIRHALVEEKQP